jgi:taurine dioxygenase
LLFRGQTLTDDSLIKFGRQFGALHQTQGLAHGAKPFGTPPEIEIISNLSEDAVPGQSLDFESAETTWHTDMSMFEEPASASILYGEEVPTGHGNTLFANLCDAYDTLPANLKEAIAGRFSIHDISYTAMGRLRAGFAPVADKSNAPGARHPITRVHPETGRKSIFLGRKGYGYVLGLPVQESDVLLDKLWNHMTRAEFVWEHSWRAGDVLMWDNRCTAHSRRAFDPKWRRRLRRVTVKGERPQ